MSEGGAFFRPLRFRARVAARKLRRLKNRGYTRSPQSAADQRCAIEVMAPCPRTIWMYWHQGWADAPPLARLSLARWARLNPDWQVVALDRDNLARVVDMPADLLSHPGMGLAARSDLVRVSVLARHGGVWADATTIPVLPLDDWLTPCFLSGFFAFSNPGPDRTVASWFLASTPSNALICGWRDLAQAHWHRFAKAPAYHWLHYLYDDAVATGREARMCHELMPKIGDRHVSVLQRSGFDPAFTAAFDRACAGGMVPMQKLSFNMELSGEFPGTPLARLLGCDSGAGIEAVVENDAALIQTAMANASAASAEPAR